MMQYQTNTMNAQDDLA